MAMNTTYKKEMASAIYSQSQGIFAKVESHCDLYRLNSYYVLEFHPSRKREVQLQNQRI